MLESIAQTRKSAGSAGGRRLRLAALLAAAGIALSGCVVYPSSYGYGYGGGYYAAPAVYAPPVVVGGGWGWGGGCCWRGGGWGRWR